MKKLIYAASILTLLLTNSCSKDSSYPAITLNVLQSDKCEVTTLSTDECGYLIYDPEQNKTVKAYNMLNSFIPASVTKLFTTVMSFELLHSDYKFNTELLYSGSINNGTIEGSLFLKGGGDPELSIHDLITLVFELKSRRIKSVKGNFFYDAELFPSQDVLNKSMPVNAKYNPGFGPLNLNGNTIYALKNTDDKGKFESCELLPSLPVNRAYLYDGPHVLLYARYSQSGDVETWGLPSHGQWENRLQLPVKNTALFTASVFRKLCSIHGIDLPPPGKGITAADAKTITTHESRELTLILKNMLVTSDNLKSEISGTMAYKKLCEQNKNSSITVEDFFKKTFPSVKWDDFRLTNYSGLTDINRATPEQTVAMLIYLSKSELHKNGLSELLPLSGLDGTMRSKLDNQDTAFRVYAKTGTIYFASALAGEFIASSGKKYLFSVFIDNKGKRKQYTAAGASGIEAAKQAEKWSADASKAIELFIHNQIKIL
jgi:D-alanyl-D-alanine carboxypeptidase/D-alanyl-D-alanine-endopeptidase (penicillin-binding protein 4)